MRILAFSDLHRDLAGAARLVERSREADAVVCAGDLASVHQGLAETVDALRSIEVPTVLVPGNNETEADLQAACGDWEGGTVLHGEGRELDGVRFYGLGAGVPVTPWEWSFDLTEEEAASMLEPCPDDAVLVLHSPPLGHADVSSGRHLGSAAIRDAIARRTSPLAVCGHIHESWGAESSIGETKVLNLGPDGMFLDL